MRKEMFAVLVFIPLFQDFFIWFSCSLRVARCLLLLFCFVLAAVAYQGLDVGVQGFSVVFSLGFESRER